MSLDKSLDYYARIGAALFPIPAGQKAPWGIVESFKDNYSRDPEQWKKWQSENPGCNFGLVAFASGLVTLDTDIKPVAGQTADDARGEAWAMRAELFKSWGMDPDTLPQVQSARGGWHDMFAIPPHIDAATLRQPDAIKGRINVRVIGYTVTAGSYYDGTAKGEESGHYQLFDNAPPPHPAPAALLEHCAPSKPRKSTFVAGTHDIDDTKALYKWMAENGVIQSDDDWRNAGMAARIEFGDAGLEVWKMLATRGGLTSESMTRWNSFDTEATANSVTIKSILKLAKDNGWSGTIRPSVGSMFAGVAQLTGAPSIAPDAAPPLAFEGVPLPSNPAAEENEANDLAHPTPAGGFIKSSAEFVQGFVPPDYLLDSVLQLRFCYSLTAQTGVGKTTVAMRLAAHVAIGRDMNGLEVQKGSVIYFAGENPTDVQMRWLGLCKEMGLDPASVDVHFIPGAMHLSKVTERITQEVYDKKLSTVLVVVDTAAAYFEGDDDNGNVQAGEHARRLRSLCDLPGRPCVLVLCHPTKNATDDNLVPRGGGAFLNEVDGNIALCRDGDTIAAFALSKFRGPEFTPLNFLLKVVRDHPLLKDSRGRQIPTIVAVPISATEQSRAQERAQTNEEKILEIVCNSPSIRNADIAKAVGWEASRVSRLMPKLEKKKLVEQPLEGRGWVATTKAQRGLNLAATAAARPVKPLAQLTPAVLGPAPFPTPQRPGTPPPMPPVPA